MLTWCILEVPRAKEPKNGWGSRIYIVNKLVQMYVRIADEGKRMAAKAQVTMAGKTVTASWKSASRRSVERIEHMKLRDFPEDLWGFL